MKLAFEFVKVCYSSANHQQCECALVEFAFPPKKLKRSTFVKAYSQAHQHIENEQALRECVACKRTNFAMAVRRMRSLLLSLVWMSGA